MDALLACAVCLALVEADNREGLVERALERLRRKDSQRGRERSLSDELGMRDTTRGHLEMLFWEPRSELSR